jgi:uncharacterized cupredoxin-like copper-binding protein
MTIVFVTLVMVAAITAACDGGGHGSADRDSAMREISIVMSDDVRFEPGRIEMTVGEPVRLVIKNEAGSVHDFTVGVIPVRDVLATGGAASGGHGAHTGYDLHLALDARSEGVLEFTALQPGEYRFVCTVTGHVDAGMVGSLVVT